MITFTAAQLVAHLVGDYIFQSDRMALEKTKSSLWAAIHALAYTLPFWFFGCAKSGQALLFIAGTHFIIDRWRLARYVVWAKNFLSTRTSHGEVCAFRMEDYCGDDPHKPLLKAGSLLKSDGVLYRVVGFSDAGRVYHAAPVIRWWHPWSECEATGYHKDRPQWLVTWLLFIADNTLHILCNAIGITAWG